MSMVHFVVDGTATVKGGGRGDGDMMVKNGAV